MNKRQIAEELARRKAKADLWTFCLYINYEFWKGREKEFKPIAEYITKIYNARISSRVAISTPPRYGKSTFANYIIAWFLLNDPNNAILRASYSQMISSELNQGVRHIMEGQQFKTLINIEFEENTQNKMRLKGSRRANVYASSVGGTTTGFGGNIIIGDDLYKDHIEALSDTINRKTITWYQSAFTSRLDGEFQLEIIIGTRWRFGELVDILESKEYFNKVFKIKALVDGKSTNESIIKTERLLQMQEVMHTSIFNSMYQQEPMESMDALIPPTSIKYINQYTPANYTYRLMVVDLADKGKDRTTAVIIDIYKDRRVVVDLLTDQSQLEVTGPRIKQMAIAYNPTHFLIEDNKESYFARLLAHELMDAGINANTFHTTKNKRTKIIMNSQQVKTWEWIQSTDQEYNLFIRNMCKYDIELKDQHDDEIDVAAMAVDFIIKLMGE
jgi:hypothetical protein